MDIVLEDRIIKISDTKELHLTKKVFNGISGYDIRWFVKFVGGQDFIRTKKGIFLNQDQFDGLFKEMVSHAS